MRYSAFISYNHRDRDWAIWLHRALERYRVPKRLWGRPAPWGTISQRLPPVFRDRDELAASADLAASVQAALAEAATLVVICSPNSAKSRWVDAEIRSFIDSGRGHLIRLIIVDGEPHSGDPARECLPPSLIRDDAPEPLAADIRDSGDGKRDARLKILAGILDVPFDELKQREAARRQKRLFALSTASSTGFLIMAALTAFALISRAQAVEQRKLADQRTVTAERTVEFVKDMFRVADPSEARGASITAREIVDGASIKLERSLRDEPTVKAELGVTLAEVYGALGLYGQGDALVRRMLTIGPVAPATRARELAALGESQLRLADYDRARASFRAAGRLSGSGGAALQSRILVGLGQTLSALEEDGASDRVLRRALAIDGQRGGADADLARDYEAIGLNLFYASKLDLARPYIVKALALREKIEGQASPSVSDNLNTLGSIAYMQGDLAEAGALFRRVVAVDERVLGPKHPDLAMTLNNLARVEIEQRRYSAAGPLLDRAIAISLAQRSATHDDMAFLFANLGLVRRHMGKLADAEVQFNRAITAARIHGQRMLGPTLADLAELRCATGRAASAPPLLREARVASIRDYPDDPWRAAWVDGVEGECLWRSGQRASGKALIAKATPVIAQRWPKGTSYREDADLRAALVR